MLAFGLMDLAHSLGIERAAIFHVDDVGMCHGANRGCLDLAERGFVTCGPIGYRDIQPLWRTAG